jgi:predicted kinase
MAKEKAKADGELPYAQLLAEAGELVIDGRLVVADAKLVAETPAQTETEGE